MSLESCNQFECGSEKFRMQKLNVFFGFGASSSRCQSSASLPFNRAPLPAPHHHLYHLPLYRNHISKLLVPLQAIKHQVTSAPAAGSCFSGARWSRAGFTKWGFHDCTQIKTSWPFIGSFCKETKLKRNEEGLSFYLRSGREGERQGFPFHLE